MFYHYPIQKFPMRGLYRSANLIFKLYYNHIFANAILTVNNEHPGRLDMNKYLWLLNYQLINNKVFSHIFSKVVKVLT